MRTVTDDLGVWMELADDVERVVSLVPSLTESIAATRPEVLVAATEWCTHPVGLDAERVRGTKNPDVRRIVELRPDLVLMNQEENRRKDAETLRAAGVPVWVTVTQSVPEALGALRRLLTIGFGWPEPDWLLRCAQLWSAEIPAAVARVVIPIWRDPWMVVGRDTFTGDLVARLGYANVFADHVDRYPRTDPADIAGRGPDVVLLPDEPYAFSADDGPDAFPGLRTSLVEGRLLTWYGPSLLTAREAVSAALRP